MFYYCSVNELWFDTGTGQVAETPYEIERLCSQVGHMAVPLRELVTNEEFRYSRGDFDRVDGRTISPELAVQLGRTIAYIFDGTESEVTKCNSEHLRRLDVLGLLPNRAYIQRNFGSITNYRTHIGVDGEKKSWKHSYDQVPFSELFDALIATNMEYGKGLPITRSKIDGFARLGLTPDYKYFHSRGLRTRKLNELLGFVDVRDWTIADYVQFGKDVLKINGEDALTEPNIALLSSRGAGPSRPTIGKHFGSLRNFRRIAMEELQHEREAEAVKTEAIHAHFRDIYYGEAEPVSSEQRARVSAKYAVARYCLRDDQNFVRLSLLPTRLFVAALQKSTPGLTQADIEVAAISLDVFDDIWPMDSETNVLDMSQYDRYVRVS